MLLKIKKDMKGITLIALVITIIVLLILAGITIGAITGDNGIINQAQSAKTENERSDIEEQINVIVIQNSKDRVMDKNKLINDFEEKLPDGKEIVESDDLIYIIYPEYSFEVDIDSLEVAQVDLSNKSIKMIVNTGEDGLVVLPFDEEYLGNVTKVNWGDGNVETIGKEDYEEKGKIASTTNNIQVASYIPSSGIYHKYNEKNKEIEVEVEGNIVGIGSLAAGMYYDKELGEYVDYKEGPSKIIEITQWGETGLEGIYLGDCRNLRKIASPTENSFKNITEFSYTFDGCTGLTSIPEDLFANCPNVTDFHGTFTECTNLTGNAIPLWERVEGYENLDFEDIDAWMETNPRGEGCYYNCTKLNNYNNIPMYWKSSPLTWE